MQIFFSHSSKQKPLIREIKHSLPHYLHSWIDEEKLLFGDDLNISIENAIKSEVDYVILFLDEAATRSGWVQSEVNWGIEAEKISGRTILLVVLIEDRLDLNPFDSLTKSRKYLRIKDYSEKSVKSLADEISSELFALLCRDMSRLRNPQQKSVLSVIAEAELALKTQANAVQKAIFPHRKLNPISAEKLCELMNLQIEEKIGESDFISILSTISQRNLVPGLVFDGIEAYLEEEHARWKSDLYKDRKEKIGKKAASFVQNGMKILIDAGSTAEEVVKIICRKIEARAIVKLTVATTSVNIADIISDCCVKMGFDDSFSAVTLLLPGGQVRPSTQTIVSTLGFEGSIAKIGASVGQFDLSFIGVNGLTENGFATHDSSEAKSKIDILSVSKKCIILGDSSKVGIELESKFCDFSDNVTFITNNDLENQLLQILSSIHSEKVIMI